jgi:hypothetical protein
MRRSGACDRVGFREACLALILVVAAVFGVGAAPGIAGETWRRAQALAERLHPPELTSAARASRRALYDEIPEDALAALHDAIRGRNVDGGALARTHLEPLKPLVVQYALGTATPVDPESTALARADFAGVHGGSGARYLVFASASLEGEDQVNAELVSERVEEAMIELGKAGLEVGRFERRDLVRAAAFHDAFGRPERAARMRASIVVPIQPGDEQIIADLLGVDDEIPSDDPFGAPTRVPEAAPDSDIIEQEIFGWCQEATTGGFQIVAGTPQKWVNAIASVDGTRRYLDGDIGHILGAPPEPDAEPAVRLYFDEDDMQWLEYRLLSLHLTGLDPRDGGRGDYYAEVRRVHQTLPDGQIRVHLGNPMADALIGWMESGAGFNGSWMLRQPRGRGVPVRASFPGPVLAVVGLALDKIGVRRATNEWRLEELRNEISVRFGQVANQSLVKIGAFDIQPGQDHFDAQQVDLPDADGLASSEIDRAKELVALGEAPTIGAALDDMGAESSLARCVGHALSLVPLETPSRHRGRGLRLRRNRP